MVAVGAAVSSNYLTLTARHPIQTLPTLEKKKKRKHRKNEGRERGEERVEGKGRGGKGEKFLSLYRPLNA